MDTTTNHDDFEFGDQPVPVEINVRGTTRTYLLRDISAEESDRIFAALAVGNEAEKSKAQKEFRDRVISTCVLRADGTKITMEEAAKLKILLAMKLSEAAMKHIKPEDEDAKND